MTIDQMRAEVLKLYKGDAWRMKVLNMTDAQVLAIYKKSVRRK